MLTGLIVTVPVYSRPELLVSLMVIYCPFMFSAGSLLHVIMTLILVLTALSTVAVQVMISSVPWYTLSSLILRYTDTAGAGTVDGSITRCYDHCIQPREVLCLLETVISTLEVLLTSTPTLVTDILLVQVYCPLSDVCSGENTSLPIVTLAVVV